MIKGPLWAFFRRWYASRIMKEKELCTACGMAPISHSALWLSNSGDIFALNFVQFRDTGIVRFLSGIGEWVINKVSGVLFRLGLLVKAFTLHDDMEKVTSARARVIWTEAKRRGIPIQQVYVFGSPIDLYRVSVHGKTYLVDSIPVPPKKQKEALHIDDKISFKKLMREAGIPTPQSYSAGTYAMAKNMHAKMGIVCVKPRSGSNGLHTYPHIRDQRDLWDAFKSAQQLCYFVSVEEHLEGNVCRATCIDGKLVGFLESAYPTVVGDGRSTIAKLIEKANAKKPEGVGDIVMTSLHHDYIDRRGYSVERVLPKGESLPLTYRAGGSSGGRHTERGRAIHESFIPIIEQAAVLTELPVVGFDLIIPDPLQSADSQKWGFIEANSLPWINLHHEPLMGEPVNIAEKVWDLWD